MMHSFLINERFPEEIANLISKTECSEKRKKIKYSYKRKFFYNTNIIICSFCEIDQRLQYSFEKKYYFIPFEIEKEHILRKAHGINFHLTVRETITSIKNFGFWWHSVPSDINKFINLCIVCQARIPGWIKKGNTPIKNKTPREMLVIDTMEIHQLLVKLTGNVYKYLLNGIDHYSKFGFSFFLKSKESKEVASNLNKIFEVYHPLKFLSDKWTKFMGFVKDLLKVFCIKV